jgi:beta-lactamase regulating signal transducer with metallopeptidase domain
MIEGAATWLAHAADGWAAWIAAASLRALPLGLVVTVLDRGLGSRAWPQLRAALWWLIIVAVLLPPGVASPISMWGVADPARVADPWVVRPPADSLCLREEFWCDVLCEHPPGRFADGEGRAGRVLLGVWVAGLVALSAATAWRSRGLRREWLSAAREPAEPWFDALCRETAMRMELRSAPEVRIQADAPGAALVGVWRPVVVVPSELVRAGPIERVRHVLMHEMAHVRRRDALASRLCAVVQLVFWFHPVVWLARARLETLREVCCDQTVVAALAGRRAAYRQTLLDLARSMIEPPRAVPLGFMHHHSQIMVRLTQLQRPLPRRPGLVRAATIAVFVLLAVISPPRARRTNVASAAEARWSKLPGCFQYQYVVLRAMAEQEARPSSSQWAVYSSRPSERRTMQ